MHASRIVSFCAGCGARLRRSKPSWASCDPCQDAADRRAYDHEQAARKAAEDASPTCRRCGGDTVAVRKGVYAYLCGECRDAARRDTAARMNS